MLPWAMPAFVAFLTWRVLYQPIGGGFNLILTQTGLYPEVIDFLGQRSTAMASVIAASVWRGFPFWFVSILAALQSVPRELHEAAIVDGASPWQRFWNVTLPGIMPVIIVTTLLSSIWTANGFEHVWLLTAGGPSDATMVFPCSPITACRPSASARPPPSRSTCCRCGHSRHLCHVPDDAEGRVTDATTSASAQRRYWTGRVLSYLLLALP